MLASQTRIERRRIVCLPLAPRPSTPPGGALVVFPPVNGFTPAKERQRLLEQPFEPLRLVEGPNQSEVEAAPADDVLCDALNVICRDRI
jgi:hypothetical protein